MTLNLSDAEMAQVEGLCERYALNKTAVMKKALRLFCLIDERIEKGEKITSEKGGVSAEWLIL